MRTFAQKPKFAQQTKPAKSTKRGWTLSGRSHEVNSILHLQRTIGNQAVQRLLQTNVELSQSGAATTASTRFGRGFSQLPIPRSTPVRVQPKLTVNTPGDMYEQEADRVAEQVMRMPEPRLRGICACGGGCPRCRNEGEGKKELQVQRLEASSRSEVEVPPSVDEVLHSPGQALEAGARKFMETRYGQDFSQVRVHTDAKASDSAR